MARILILLCFSFLTSNAKSLNKVEDTTCGYDACPVYDPDVLNVHLIPHSHDDVGWLKTVEQYYYQDVQYVLSSVVPALKQKSDRKFVQVETAYFAKWWATQTEEMKEDVRNLVNNGQMEIIGGGWSMNDEGAVHYQSTIDQFTLGLRFIDDVLGKCGRPRVGWQIDTFGHSREQASINAQMGFDGIFFARFDFRDKEVRQKAKTTDMLWRGSASLGNTSDLFTSIVHNSYSYPSGFCFDIVCQDEPMIDDEESADYNYQRRVEEFADYVRSQASVYPTNNILITMGDDFRYSSSLTNYLNIDLLIRGFERFPQEFENKSIKLYYSTPSCYTKAVHQYVISNQMELDVKTDDFLPLAQDPSNYWVGYYISRASSKRYERFSNNFLQVAKQLAAFSNTPYDNSNIKALKEIVGVMQHHDAITGTERQFVANNYHMLFANALQDTDNETQAIIERILSDESSPPTFKLHSCLRLNMSICEQSTNDEFVVSVYNPLSRVVSTPINFPADSDDYKISDSQGNELTYQLEPAISNFNYVDNGEASPNTLTFDAVLPPLSLSFFRVKKNKIQQSKNPLSDIKDAGRIGYDDTWIELDGTSGLLKTVHMNGVSLDVKQEFLYYISSGGSGSYMFLPHGDDKHVIAEEGVKTERISGDIYEGVVQEFGSWAKQIIKIYKNDQSHIEFDWLIGPLDISDDWGKEVVSVISTSLETESTWYTDSNGREMIQRVRSHRPTFNYTDELHVPGNYYPINSRVVIKDESKGLELAIITDRSQGGTSLEDGQIEIMIHRACMQNDFGDNLNEQEYGQGIVVRGQHYLILGPTEGNGEKSLATMQREIALKKQLAPWSFFSDSIGPDVSHNYQLGFMNAPLPDNVHLLTLEPWRNDSVLLRVEHILEKDDDPILSKEVVVDFTDMFTAFKITEMFELTLGANRNLGAEFRLEWPGSSQPGDDNGVLNIIERLNRYSTDLKIALAPMQIRTFEAKVTYN